MHLRRLIVVVIVLPLLYLYITKLSAVYFLFLVMAVSVITQYEFYSMYNVNGKLKYIGISFGVLMILALSLQPSAFSLQLFDMFAVLFLVIACIRLFSKRNPESSLYDISAVIAGVLYIPVLLSYQMYLRVQGAEWIIFLYGCVWASDSMAYYIGTGIGRKKLYQEISPNKTVEGAYGSIAGGTIGAIILKGISLINLSLINAIIFGLIVGAVTIVGDLVESMFKRDAGVKDSSSIIPGHGGLLDKIDSALFAGPVLYWVSKGLGLIR
jgi:phosphatidate cytidylyltransferase